MLKGVWHNIAAHGFIILMQLVMQVAAAAVEGGSYTALGGSSACTVTQWYTICPSINISLNELINAWTKDSLGGHSTVVF